MLALEKVNIVAPAIDWSGLPKRFMNDGELEIVCAILNAEKPKTVIEFGINVGRTAKAILREVEGIKSYIGVDVLPGYVTEKIVQRKEIPEQAAEMVISDKRLDLRVSENGSFDLSDSDLPEIHAAFIDGDHSYRGVEKDTALARSCIKKGVIIWHDYHDMGCVDVRDFLHDQVKAGHDIKHVDGTWLAFEIIR